MGFRLLAGLALLVGALASGPGCESPPPVVPAEPEPPVEPPPEPEPEPEEEPYPVVSRCQYSTIRVGAPRRVDVEDRGCSEAYEVDFAVEGSPGDAMLLDMFQTHTLWNWRVEDLGEGVRHAFTLRMQPVWQTFWSISREASGIRGHEPLVVQACPEDEGAGPVLACTTDRCGIYDELEAVPPLRPEELELAVTLPRAFLHETLVREGETVEIPLTFRIFRPLPRDVLVELGFDWRHPPPAEWSDVDLSPTEILLPAGTRRSHTRVARLKVTRYDVVEEFSPYAPFLVVLKMTVSDAVGNQFVPRCSNPPRKGLYFRLVPKDW